MRHRFITSDVFTDRAFAGNPLAVLPEAEGLTTEQMQAVANEFNLSETTFVLPPDDPAHLCRLRIFTPKAELPFAGHPTVGTALVLARLGRLSERNGRAEAVLGLAAGPTPISVRFRDGRPTSAEVLAPQRPKVGPRLETARVETALGLAPADLVADGPMPCVASCGTEFLCVELGQREALARARDFGVAGLGRTGIFLVTRDTGEAGVDFRARMFAPQLGVAEDPATGSAAAALAGLLALADDRPDVQLAWRIAQGVEMGRPSLIEARAERRGGEVVGVWIAGSAVPVAEGWIDVSG